MKEKVMPEKTEKPTPPYLPYRTFRNFIDGLRVGIPGKIDRSMLRSFSGVTQSMLISTLRYFKLITADGTPTETLSKLVQAEPVDRQRLLRDLLSAVYPFMFGRGINLQNATPDMVRKEFAKAGVTGDTVRKAVVFFLAAAQDADVPLSQYLKVRQVRTARRRTSTKTNGGTPRETAEVKSDVGDQQTPYDMLISILDPEAMDEEEQKAVWILIRYLKKREGESGR